MDLAHRLSALHNVINVCVHLREAGQLADGAADVGWIQVIFIHTNKSDTGRPLGIPFSDESLTAPV